MKKFMAIFISLIVLLFLQQSFASVNPSSFEYEVNTGDVGVIKTQGATKSVAFESAAEECFNRRLALYESQRGPATEERLLDFVDSCANLKW